VVFSDRTSCFDMASALDLLFGPPFSRAGKRGVNPNAPDPRPGTAKPPNPLDQFLGSPGGSLLVNLLSQSGFSPFPQSQIGALGRGLLQTQQQGQQRQRSGLEDDLLRARIGLAQAQSVGGGATAGNVQTTFKGANGNMHIVTRRGDVKDTGIAFNENVKFFTQGDGSVIGVDASTGDQLGTVISAKEAAAATTRKKQTEAAFTLPKDLAGLDTTIRKVDNTIRNVEQAIGLVSPTTTGAIGEARKNIPGVVGGEARTLRNQIKVIQANLGFDELTAMRAASKTGGALGQVSERELDLLVSAKQALDQGGDDEVLRDNLLKVIEHYNNYKREIEIMKDAMRGQAGVTTELLTDEPKIIDFRDLPNGGS